MAGARTILIVEDEPIIAMMLAEFVEALGHSVVGDAGSVAEALLRIEDGGFDLVLLDVQLNDGKPCWPVADALAARNIPFILASGGSVAVSPPAYDNAPRLAKPYGLGDVEAAIGRLDATASE